MNRLILSLFMLCFTGLCFSHPLLRANVFILNTTQLTIPTHVTYVAPSTSMVLAPSLIGPDLSVFEDLGGDFNPPMFTLLVGDDRMPTGRCILQVFLSEVRLEPADGSQHFMCYLYPNTRDVEIRAI